LVTEKTSAVLAADCDSYLKPWHGGCTTSRSINAAVFWATSTGAKNMHSRTYELKRKSLKSRSARPAPFRPALERLEDRCLPDATAPILPHLPATPQINSSTVPPNGDVNPYGVAFVPEDFVSGGAIHPGDILVANFNNRHNVQGTGTTIVSVTPKGTVSQFFHGPSTPGLDTALGVLERGFVLVGNVPTTDGSFKTIGQGSLTILDKNGHVVVHLTDNTLLDGPWDLTVHDEGDTAQVFVANVLSGTVTRIDLKIPEGGKPVVESMTQIASGYTVMPNMGAVVLGPTGLAYDAARDILYVASTGDNKIFAVSDAKTRTGGGTGRVVFQNNPHLRGPLGLALAPNGDLITANGDAVNANAKFPSELVEFTPDGHFVAQRTVDASAEGGAFGLAIESSDDRISLAAVDDVTNTLKVFTIHEHDDRAATPLAIPGGQDLGASKPTGDVAATVGGATGHEPSNQGSAASVAGSGATSAKGTLSGDLPKGAGVVHQSTRQISSADFTGAIDWIAF
jgi:hypothetical protein